MKYMLFLRQQVSTKGLRDAYPLKAFLKNKASLIPLVTGHFLQSQKEIPGQGTYTVHQRIASFEITGKEVIPIHFPMQVAPMSRIRPKADELLSLVDLIGKSTPDNK